MRMIRNLAGRLRFAAMLLVLLVLTCGTPSQGWCGGEDLWIAYYDGGGIGSFTSKQLKKSGMQTPTLLSSFNDVLGIAFDKSHNLWAVVGDNQVVRFTAAQLKNLESDPNPTPGVIITSSATFGYIQGCNFDPHGNLWVVDADNDSLDELSTAQLSAGSGNLTPAIVIDFSSDLKNPDFVIFDRAGNAWVNGQTNSKIGEFSASQLTSGGSKSPNVLLSDDGSGTSLDSPGQIAFDKHGNLWVPNSAGTVVEYAKDEITASGSPVPVVKLNSSVFEDAFEALFDSKGDLLVSIYGTGTIAKFTAKQIKVSGAPVPKISVTETESNNFQTIFGPSS